MFPEGLAYYYYVYYYGEICKVGGEVPPDIYLYNKLNIEFLPSTTKHRTPFFSGNELVLMILLLPLPVALDREAPL